MRKKQGTAKKTGIETEKFRTLKIIAELLEASAKFLLALYKLLFLIGAPLVMFLGVWTEANWWLHFIRWIIGGAE